MKNDDEKKDKPCVSSEKYDGKPIRFFDKGDHYEFYFTGDFDFAGKDCTVLTDILIDLKEADKQKEIHIFIDSPGGYCSTLTMILSYIMQFDYRVTICTGIAMSCGLYLWSCGHEKYVAPYSELMLHAVSSAAFGKGKEIVNVGISVEKLNAMYQKTLEIDKIFTPEEIKLAETSEVWILGQDMIDRKVAKDLKEYERRVIPCKKDVYCIGDDLYVKERNHYVVYKKSNAACNREHKTYRQLIELATNKSK